MPAAGRWAHAFRLRRHHVLTNSMKLRLYVMMFMEFFTWGGWFVTMGSFLALNLHATGEQSGLAYSTQAWGAIIAPFIVDSSPTDTSMRSACSAPSTSSAAC